MTSQGWAPGQYLGAVDAPHAEFHTEANASHIRVMLKDDNLGIGAKKGSGVEQGECVGLDVFQTLLGRLNATDEDEFEREQRSREDLKRAIYTERKWGSIRFVSGGFLIGDKIQDLIDGEAERIRRLGMADSSDSSDTDSDSGSESETTPEPVVVKEKKSKKSSKKIVEIDIETSAVVLETESSSTSKSKKKRKLAETDADESVKTKKSKKSKKEKSSRSDDSESKHSKKSKKEKRSKKEKKSEDDATSKSSKSKSKRSRDDAETAEPAPAVAATPTPVAAAAAPRPILLGGRHAVRARNIEQKRLAATHAASLNEVSFVLWDF